MQYYIITLYRAACCVPRLTQPSTLRGTVKWVSAFELSNNKMAMMYVGHNIAAYRRTRSPGRLAWSEGRRPSGAGLRTSDEPGELSQWLSHDGTINIVIRIITIIIITHLKHKRRIYRTRELNSNIINRSWQYRFQRVHSCCDVINSGLLWNCCYGRPTVQNKHDINHCTRRSSR